GEDDAHEDRDAYGDLKVQRLLRLVGDEGHRVLLDLPDDQRTEQVAERNDDAGESGQMTEECPLTLLGARRVGFGYGGSDVVVLRHSGSLLGVRADRNGDHNLRHARRCQGRRRRDAMTTPPNAAVPCASSPIADAAAAASATTRAGPPPRRAEGLRRACASAADRRSTGAPRRRRTSPPLVRLTRAAPRSCRPARTARTARSAPASRRSASPACSRSRT